MTLARDYHVQVAIELEPHRASRAHRGESHQGAMIPPGWSIARAIWANWSEG